MVVDIYYNILRIVSAAINLYSTRKITGASEGCRLVDNGAEKPGRIVPAFRGNAVPLSSQWTMGGGSSTETSVNFYQATRCHTPEGGRVLLKDTYAAY
jgi:hypothetical protein